MTTPETTNCDELPADKRSHFDPAPIRWCPFCRTTPLSGRQQTCSPKCRKALSRRRKAISEAYARTPKTSVVLDSILETAHKSGWSGYGGLDDGGGGGDVTYCGTKDEFAFWVTVGKGDQARRDTLQDCRICLIDPPDPLDILRTIHMRGRELRWALTQPTDTFRNMLAQNTETTDIRLRRYEHADGDSMRVEAIHPRKRWPASGTPLWLIKEEVARKASRR